MLMEDFSQFANSISHIAIIFMLIMMFFTR